jgi:hypothetical protein
MVREIDDVAVRLAFDGLVWSVDEACVKPCAPRAKAGTAPMERKIGTARSYGHGIPN